MEIVANAAAWVGAGSMLALAGWALGRWHGLPERLIEQPSPPVAGNDCPETTLTPMLLALAPQPRRMANADVVDYAVSLSDLHTEITALRQREQILATLAPDHPMMDGGHSAAGFAPARPMPEAPVVTHSTAGGERAGAQAPPALPEAPLLKMPQPSSAAASLTRV